MTRFDGPGLGRRRRLIEIIAGNLNSAAQHTDLIDVMES